ncbi:MAG: formylmethanofuran dehydrogenase subunit A [Thermoproteota archaeon]|nr:MAG: formylmethanofuran dehydrogenase subunit A [Candidatus Korarchaeota archaeon]
MELIVRGGYVYDPANGVNGEKIDIYVKDGKIVESVEESKAKVIDASGMIVMPGGVDLHSHIAGAKVNSGRVLRPEDHVKDPEPKTKYKRSGVGRSVPSTFTTGYRYAVMGYTTVMEPASPPLKTRHTHEELNDTPIVDKACLPMFGNNWFVMEFLKEGDVDKCITYVGWMINVLKGFGVKIVNPGGVEAWGWGKNLEHIDDKVPYFDITPREILRGLCKAAQELNLPTYIHVHANALGRPGNFSVTMDTMECVRDLAKDGKADIHMVHIQFNAFGGDDWSTLRSAGSEISDYVNRHTHVTLDMGQIIFGDTTTMTADGPWQYELYKLSGNKWVNSDVEAETGVGIVPYVFRRKSYVNAVQWTIGLEVALLVKDKWRLCLSTDHPNGGPFTEYPRIIAWLMSKEARRRTLRRIHSKAAKRSILDELDYEYSLYDIAIVTRAAPAKILGLKNKGHLGIGADADIAIYDLNPKEVDFSRDYKAVRKAFRRAAYTIKDGKVVVKDGEIVSSHIGRTYWTKITMKDPSRVDQLVDEIRDRFQEYYTVSLSNYPISEEYLHRGEPINVKAAI